MSKAEQQPGARRRNTPTPRTTTFESRRRFLKLAATGAAIVATGTVGAIGTRSLLNSDTKPRHDEGNEPTAPGEYLIRPNDIVNETTLIAQFHDFLDGKKVDQTQLTASIVYNASLFFGLDEATARRRTEKTRFLTGTDTGLCTNITDICVTDSSSGLSVEVGSKVFDSVPNPESMFGFFTHEAAHMAVTTIDDSSSTEDYGVLGNIQNRRDRRGFASNALYSDALYGLVERIEPKSNNQFILPEEFFAEVGKITYIDHLIHRGLKVKLENLYTGYPGIDMGVVNYTSKDVTSDWQKQLGLPFSQLADMHLKAQRHELYLTIGTQIKKLNPLHPSLSPENTAALGVVALADFTQIDLTGYRFINDKLLNENITPQSILYAARQLTQ